MCILNLNILILITCFMPIIVYTTNICIDTFGWADKINSSTCSDYVRWSWCENRMFNINAEADSLDAFNYPDLNCCQCGKRKSLHLSTNARWSQNATTIVGKDNGTPGSSLSELNGNYGIYILDDDILYVADSGNNRIVIIPLDRNERMQVILGGNASDISNFYNPTDIFVTRTFIYVMDTWRYRVQKWLRNGTNPVNIAGIIDAEGTPNTTSAIGESYNLFVDNYNNLYISDFMDDRVLFFKSNSTNTTNSIVVAGTGIKGNASNQLDGPSGIFVDERGNLYIADFYNHRIQIWPRQSTSGITIAGTGIAGRSLSNLDSPNAIILDLNGYMYISDSGNNRIIRWAPGASNGECIAGCTGYAGLESNRLDTPTSIAFDAAGSLYVNDWNNNRVQKFEILLGSVTMTNATLSSTSLSYHQHSYNSTNRTSTSNIINPSIAFYIIPKYSIVSILLLLTKDA